jgi:hypothetical protein
LISITFVDTEHYTYQQSRRILKNKGKVYLQKFQIYQQIMEKLYTKVDKCLEIKELHNLIHNNILKKEPRQRFQIVKVLHITSEKDKYNEYEGK